MAAKSKLVIVTTVPETLATILRDQPRAMSAMFDVVLISSGGEGLEAVAQHEGVRCVHVPMVRGISIWRDAYALVVMALKIQKEQANIVHSYTPKAGLIAMLAAWICRVPVRIHTFTGLIFPTSAGLKKLVLIQVDRIVCRCATLIVPEGVGVKRDLLVHGITSKPLDVIGHGNIAGVDTAHYARGWASVREVAQDLSLQLGLSDDDFLFVYVGRINRDKGIDELWRAFDALPSRAKLAIVGDFDLTAPISSELLASLRSNPNIFMLGHLHDIRPVLELAKVLVLPSYREGFPNVVLQAQSMEVPVIATNVNGSNEIIAGGTNGWLVEARDWRQLRAAMEYVLGLDRTELERAGNLGRAKICAYFERTEHWSRLKKLYSNQLDSCARRKRSGKA